MLRTVCLLGTAHTSTSKPLPPKRYECFSSQGLICEMGLQKPVIVSELGP